ncbi:MAG: response regulator [Flavisolibacter sp.]
MKPNPPLTILLADDDRDHGILFGHILKDVDASIKLSIVYNGQDLLHFLSKHQVDLVFLDLKMPCKNGHECLKDIRNNEKLKDLPVIMYSSSAYMSDIRKAFVHQADFYMVKPFSADHLRNALVSILSIDWKKPVLKRHYFINNRFVPYTA